jgi:Cu2+-exporting ATPase
MSSEVPRPTPAVSTDNAKGEMQATACDHCGLPAPPRQGSELTFCCSGCRGAYQLIHHWGLEDYYDLRDRLLDPRLATATPSTQASSRASWEDLDDDELLGASKPQDVGDGLLCSRLAIEGVHCGACVWLIERMATIVPGLQYARVGMHDHSVEITFNPNQIKLSQIAEKLSGIGYRLLPWVEGAGAERYRAESRQRLVQIAIAGFCAMNAMWIAVAIYAGEHSGIAASQILLLRSVGVLLGVVATFGPGLAFFRGAWASIKTRTPHMDLPIAIGVGAGALGGLFSLLVGLTDIYFDSVAVLVFLLLVGRWIQFRQQHRAADAVSMLMRMTPMIAVRVEPDGAHQKVHADSLQVGDRIYVVAGDAIPVDGEVMQGESSIDRSFMTGESRPMAISQGDTVEAGVLNLRAPIIIVASATRADSRITKLMKLVEEASLKRTPIVQLADAIAARFVIIILLLALLTIVFWWHIGPMKALSHSVALLIVACPCALALATPLAIAVTLGRAAKRKLLIRSGETLERLSISGTIWFDKTGTLTTGRPVAMTDELNDETLRLCASLESQSTHPMARAIVGAAIQRSLALAPMDQIQDVEQTIGAGIRGVVERRYVSIGNANFVKRSILFWDDHADTRVAEIAARGATPVVISIDGEFTAVIEVGDALRTESIETVKCLNERGWAVGILSGDHPGAVQAIANRLGTSALLAHGGLSPEQKLQMIEQSKVAGKTVLMVGDGINDAAALAAADVGIAVRGGAEASLQAAPVYLIDGDLRGIVKLIDASQRTVKVIRRNFRASLFYNSIAVMLAMSGMISPLIAAILMPISSLTILSMTLTSRTFEDAVASDGRPT